ncbi:hypothetical protein K1719_017116 [Acacia pycnantha]|nr:hypothetical protein K1719_017116 [Acacia pycnantha]
MDDQCADNIESGPKQWGVLNEEGSLGDVHDPDLIPQDLQQHLIRAGFWHVSRMKRLPIDKYLISALVERWRLETHTFHMLVGEMTVTLQDVEAILGLSTTGRVVSGRTHGNWAAIMQQYMGLTPLPDDMIGGTIRMSWFDRHWGHWEEHSAIVEGQLLYTRAYLMRLFGGFLLCDKSSSEIWAWSRFPAILPPIPPPGDVGDHYGRRFNNVDMRLLQRDLGIYRVELDQMGRDDVKWEPYRDAGYEFIGVDVDTQDMWRAVTPVLALHIVEMH